MKAYHGSTKEFNKFSLDKFNRGDYGYGIYFTRDKGYAQNYGSVKEYDIPDSDEMLDMEASLDYQPEYIQEKIKTIAYNFLTNKTQKGLESYNKLSEVMYRDYCNTGWNIYEVLWEICGSSKEASLFLDKNGIKGIDASFRHNCYIVFNPHNIKQLSGVTESFNKIYYHGSNNKFTKFDKSKIGENKLGLCFNFTDDIGIAYQYGDNILKVHLDLNNPITEDDLDHVLTYEEDLLLCDTMGFPKISKEKFEQEKGRYSETIGSLYKVFKMKPKFIQFLQKLGYDGVSFPEDHHFGVFEPEQIHIINDEIKESLEKLGEKLYPTYFTKSAYDIANLIKNKPDAYRLLFDKNYGYWLIGNANVLTHIDLLYDAGNVGLYYNEKDFDAHDYYEAHTKNNGGDNTICRLVFMPFNAYDGPGAGYSSDGYDLKYSVDTGVIYANHNYPLDDTDLGKLLTIKDIEDMDESIKQSNPFTKSVVQNIVYHGTNGKFKQFKTNKMGSHTDNGVYGKGFYFTDDKNQTYKYGKNQLTCYINIENPLYLGRDGQYDSFVDYANKRKGIPPINNSQDYEKYGHLMATQKEGMSFLKEDGYDGIIVHPYNGAETEYVVFKPEQIQIVNKLQEKLEELNDSIYATNSAYDILNWMKNKPRELRIIYDDSINTYFFGDAFNYIHQDILEEAYYQGFYPDMLSSSEARDKVDNHKVTLFAFYPNGGRKLDIEKSSDGYTRKYVYDFGVIYAHEETPLEDCPLYKLLGEPIKKENVFECKTDFKKLNTILEGFIKDYEEVAKIIKDKNGYNVIEDGEVLLDNSYSSLKRMLYDISRNLEE